MRLQGTDRLQQNGTRFGDGRLVRQLGRHNKRHFAGVHGVVAAVQQGGFQPDHRVARQHAVFGCLPHALFDSGEEVLRHAAAEHIFGKFHALAGYRLELDPHVTELPVTAGLLFVATLRLAALADGFAVRYARRFQRDLHAELVLQLCQRHFQVLGTQAADDLLLGFGVHLKGDGGVLLHQAGQCAGNLALVALFGNLDRHTVPGNGVHGGGQADHAGGVAEGIAGFGGGQLGNGADVAGQDRGGVGLLFAADGQRLAQALGLGGAAVDGVAGRGQFAGQHLDKAQLAHKRVRHGLKDIGAQRGVGVGGDLHGVAVRILCHGSGGVGAGQQHIHIVQQHIQCLLVDGTAAEHGGDLTAAHTGCHTLHDLLGREGFALKEFFHQGFVGFGDRLAHSLDQALETVTDVGQVDLHLLAALILERLLAEQVDVRHGAVVQTRRDDTGADAGTELDLHLFENFEVVGIFQIGFGDKDHPRLVVFQCQMVGFFGTYGDAGATGNTDQNAFCGGDALDRAGFKVKQTGGVDQVVFYTLILHGDDAGIQRCLAADFFGVKVAGGGAVLNTTHTLGCAAHIQQCLGQRRFAAAGVTGHQDVADVFACVVHCVSNLFSRRAGLPRRSNFMGGGSLFVFLNTSHLFDTTLPHFEEILNSFFAISEKILYKDWRCGFIQYDVGWSSEF